MLGKKMGGAKNTKGGTGLEKKKKRGGGKQREFFSHGGGGHKTKPKTNTSRGGVKWAGVFSLVLRRAFVVAVGCFFIGFRCW